MQTQHIYTGIDKLLMAAMMDESATHMIAVNNFPTGYQMPRGRTSGGASYHLGSGAAETHIPRAPSNKSELELYRLLERANLLGYFETFLKFGGDDVRQLCEADEEEFIEIMGLVGMTHKPLHVRRLQKALVEWRADRGNHLRLDLDDSENANSGRSTFGSIGVRNTSAAPTRVGGFYHNWIPIATTNATPTSKPPVDGVSHKLEESRQCLLQREVLIGAAKRPRLLDSLHRRPTNQPDRQSPGLDIQRSSFCDEHRSSSPIAASQLKNTGNSDETYDRLIEVLENSQSDTELEVSTMTTTRTSDSPSLVGYPHSKYGRYKASLLQPQSKSGQP